MVLQESSADTVAIAFVEDNLDLLKLLQLAASADPAMRCVGGFEGAEPAIDYLQAAREDELPDVLIMDWSMPGMSAPEAISRIMDRWPQMCILVYTAHPPHTIEPVALQRGARAVVHKAHDVMGLLEKARAFTR